MRRCDKYPPGTEEDARSLPDQKKVCGLHPLVWALLVMLAIASVGAYSEMVGFYEIDDFGEIILGDDDDDDDDDDDEEDDDEVDDSEAFSDETSEETD